jgi:hypothetical protein
MPLQVVPMDVFPLIDRSKMPQIHQDIIPDLLVFLSQRNIQFAAGIIDPQLIRLHQEVDIAKAMAIPVEYLIHPILLADDEFVLDGDHRAYRHWVNKTMVSFIKVRTPFVTAYQVVMEFTQTVK